MPQPTPASVHIDAALTNVSVAYMQSAEGFVANRVFPEVPVDKASDKYFKYDKEFWFTNEARKRAPATESAGSGYGISQDSYSCDVYALHKDVDDQTRANADPGIDPDADAARFVTAKLMIRREVDWANTYFTTGVWGTDVVGGTNFTKWSDEGASDPIEDVKTGRLTLLANTGMRPNTMVMGIHVFEALKKHPLILERVKYTSAQSVTAELIARLFEVQRILVAEAIYSNTNEGAAFSGSFILGKHALLAYVAPQPALMTPSAGYTFVWRNYTSLNNLGMGTATFRMQHLKADRVEAEMVYDQKLVAADCGYFFSGAAD